MEKRSVSTSETPTVVIVVEGDVQIKGIDELEVIAKSDADELTLETQDQTVTVRCPADCRVKVPRHAKVVVDVVHGNAMLKALEGSVEVKLVHGDLVLRSSGPADIGTVHGNLEARNVMGDLKSQLVEGNVTVRDIQGNFTAGDIQGNLVAGDVNGAIEITAQGNAVLNLDPTPGNNYQITAEGNIVCNLPEDASVQIEIERAGKIVTSLPTASGERPTEAPCSLTMGEGEATLHFSAGGNIVMSGQLPDFEPLHGVDFDFSGEFDGMAESISDQITQQIDVQMQMMEQQLNAHLNNLSVNIGTVGLPPEQVERIQQRAREASERATQRAQEKMRQAQEKLERKMAAVQQRAEQKARQAEVRGQRRERRAWGFSWPGVPQPPGFPTAPQAPVSEDERLAVLRMLEQKKITPEEAEMLLSALEGKEG